MIKQRNAFFPAIVRLCFVSCLLVGAFVFAMFQGGVVSWTIFYAILPFLLYSIFLFLYPLNRFQVQRNIQTSHFQTGDVMQVEVTLTRKYPFPLLYVVVKDEWKVANTEEVLAKKEEVFLVGFRKQLQWTYEVHQLSRGEYLASDIEVTAKDFFGWMQKRKVFTRKNRALVFPKLVELRSTLSETNYDGSARASIFNLLDSTNIVSGIREYEAGDRMSWIHWKSFARTQSLMTKEFEHRGANHFQLLFDHRPAKTFEGQVSLAASILKDMQRERTPIQFVSIFDKNQSFAISSSEEYHLALTYLAKVQPLSSEEAALPYIQDQMVETSGALVVVTGRVNHKLTKVLKGFLGNGRSVICFLVSEDSAVLDVAVLQEIKEAKAQGMVIHVVKEQRLADAFKEVIR